VWLADAGHGQHLYYAHLDKQLVQPGQLVKAGDTLGLVGNTGTARTTNPHLHFGVYRAGHGAVDPYPFVRHADVLPPAPRTKPERLGQWVRVSEKATNLRRSPAAKGATVAAMSRNTPLFVLGSQASWYRVEQPDGRIGYVAADAVVPAATPVLRREALAQSADLYAYPTAAAVPLDMLPAQSQVAVLGEFRGFRLVRSTSGAIGWLSKALTPQG
jgi:SH3-like domain-containing protein